MQHDLETRGLLRYCGMSEQSELSADEKKNLPAAKAKFLAGASSNTVYRTLRPLPEESESET